jgi:hypothetical protein
VTKNKTKNRMIKIRKQIIKTQKNLTAIYKKNKTKNKKKRRRKRKRKRRIRNNKKK